MKLFWNLLGYCSLVFVLSILATVIFSSWQSKECDHIYVAVEQAQIEAGSGISVALGTIGKVQGKELVCIKCFKRIRQIVNYTVPPGMVYDTMKNVFSLTPEMDSILNGKYQ